MRKRLKFLLLAFCVMIIGACDNMDNETDIAFIGDSLIARWDLETYFPVCKTQNLGLIGSGIEWLEQHQSTLIEQTAVVLTGTNDLKHLDEISIDDYACQYIDAVIGLGAKKIILISILPKNSKSDSPNINQLIMKLNQSIAAKVDDEKKIEYCDVYSAFLKEGTLNMNLSYDGIHLNQYGYEILARNIKSHL